MINLPATPLQEYPSLAKELTVEKLYIKREDLNPSDSHKDRGLWPFVDMLITQGESEFCLSSSGNLAISAAYYGQKNPQASFQLFLPETLSNEKRERLQTAKKIRSAIHPPNITIVTNGGLIGNVGVHWSKKPKADAIKLAKERKVRLLRGSTDDGMLMGYHGLAKEITDQLTAYGLPLTASPIGSIFMAVSSGTMAVGLFEGFNRLKACGLRLPQLHIVQTTRVHPIASEFDKDFNPSKTSIASAIVDRIAHRKMQVMQTVKESGGFGWVEGDKEIEAAVHTLEKLIGGIVSPESAMSLAGLQKAHTKGFQVAEPAVLVFTGK